MFVEYLLLVKLLHSLERGLLLSLLLQVFGIPVQRGSPADSFILALPRLPIVLI